MSEEMIELLKNVNLSSLHNEKSIVDLIKVCKEQGAIEVWKQVLDKANRTYWDNKDWQIYAKIKLRELEGEQK